MDIAKNLITIKEKLPDHVSLIAISKYHPQEAIQKLYDVGHRKFGESRMQEVAEKEPQLPKDIEWHFIGHLQRNKVKDIIPYTHTIHSVDSVRLIKEIDKCATNAKKEVCCLLQLHIADEESKYGFSFDECRDYLETGDWKKFEYAYLGGVMGMGTFTDDEDKVREEFRQLKLFFDEIKEKHFAGDKRFSEISMGMSHDYQIAVEEGSTMIRIGTSIFGEREY